MFRWYCNAVKFYIYLTDISVCKWDTDSNPSWDFAF